MNWKKTDKNKMLEKKSTAYFFLSLLSLILLNPLELFSQDNDITEITVMVAYTEKAKDWADENEGGIENVISQGIASTNQAFMNSNLDVEIKLAYSYQVNYSESSNAQKILGRLSLKDDGYMDAVHDLRDEYNADLVSLLYDDDINRGAAVIPDSHADPRYGFSVLDVQRVNDAFAHEIGHSLGFDHSRNQKDETAGPNGGRFKYSTGWRWTGNDGKGYVSIMTYSEGDIPVPHYSNPDINYKGVPTGSYSGKYAPADNARTLREMKMYLAGYRGPAHEGDSLAVLKLYESTNGDNWDESTNWFTDEPFRKWKGIETLAWRIFDLGLRSNNLTGELPSEIGNLRDLRYLDLSYNNISGTIPKSLYELLSLEELYLTRNKLTGSISSSIKRFKKLSFLSLSSNQLSGEIPNEISNLSNLRDVDLGNNHLTGSIPGGLGKLKMLYNLSLDNNQLTGSIPSELGNLSSLNYLRLDNNDLRGPMPLSFTKLEQLYELYFNETYLCLPSDQDFLNWLSNVQDVKGNEVMCQDVQPGDVALEVPSNNSTDQSLSPLLQWTQSENADNYHIQISKDEGFNDLVLDSSNVKSTELQANNLESGTTYYWRIRGTNDYLDSEWTNTWSFTTSDAPPPDNIVLSTQENNIELNWTPVDSDAVTSYLIFKGETTASLELYETIDPGQSTFSEEPSQGSSFYAVSAEYGEEVQSNITTILSYYNDIQTISDSWQLIGIPVQGEELNPQNVDLFGFDRIYKRDETMQPGKGYWIRSDDTAELDVAGEGLIENEVELNSGWNIVGGITDVISASSINDPSGILTDASVYEYSGSSYSQASNLEPGKGYWIYASEDGMIELEHGEPQVSSKRKEKPLLADINALNFQSGTASQTFWVSEQPIDEKDRLSFLMPPKAPEPIIDVRTTDGYAIGDENRLAIDITAASFPVEVTAQMNQEESGDYAYRLVGIEDGREAHYNLSASKSVRIEKNYDQFYLERVQKDELITEYSLHSNYPNPFNPSTNISYQLPRESHVMVEVFDIAGRRVASLVDATQRAGVYTVRFDGSNQASGIYFLRFQAEQFTDIQKLTLIK